jgi:hypothetical protein
MGETEEQERFTEVVGDPESFASCHPIESCRILELLKKAV